MNLLDKASIILTPTAYNNGEALCVKPSDGSGDFDFSRNSAATRVNAQGLVEDVQILSSNLVQNGDFSELGPEEVSNGSFYDGETDWSFGTGWSVGEDKANGDGTGAAYSIALQSTPISALSGNTIKLEYTISNYVSGFVRPTLGVVNGLERSSNGTFIEYIKLGSNAPSLQLINRCTLQSN